MLLEASVGGTQAVRPDAQPHAWGANGEQQLVELMRELETMME